MSLPGALTLKCALCGASLPLDDVDTHVCKAQPKPAKKTKSNTNDTTHKSNNTTTNKTHDTNKKVTTHQGNNNNPPFTEQQQKERNLLFNRAADYDSDSSSDEKYGELMMEDENVDYDRFDKDASYRATFYDKDASKRAVQIAAENTIIAADSLEALGEQEEEIKKMQDGVADLHDNLDQAHRKIKNMESFWYAIGHKFRKRRHHHKKKRAKFEANLAKENHKEEENKKKEEKKSQKKKSQEGKSTVAVGNELPQNQQKLTAYDDINEYLAETDKDLDTISNYLDTMLEQGSAMSQTLSDQDKRVSNLQEETDKAQTRIEKQNLKMKKLK